MFVRQERPLSSLDETPSSLHSPKGLQRRAGQRREGAPAPLADPGSERQDLLRSQQQERREAWCTRELEMK